MSYNNETYWLCKVSKCERNTITLPNDDFHNLAYLFLPEAKQSAVMSGVTNQPTNKMHNPQIMSTLH